MVDPNTRQGKRTPVTLKIKFKSETLEQFIERYAVDVSQGGIFIRTKEPLAVGTQMRFEFQLRDASPLIAGEGTVVWTRENDPSRPAIAPGMGVRFDRLAEGSQTVLERILSEKAKQAPSRGAEVTKPPIFTDTPTKVAPAPVQEALLGEPKSRPSGNLDGGTPLPKPMPFHSDAEDFDEQAFEEATKVRAVDELVAQSALAEEPAAPAAPAAPAPSKPTTVPPENRPVARLAVSSTPPSSPFDQKDDADSAAPDRDSTPALPTPPQVEAPRVLDTPRAPSPSPALLGAAAAAADESSPARTKLGVEPARPASVNRPANRATPAPVDDAPSGPYPTKKSSSAMPMVILVLFILAAAAAGVWFFVLREKAKPAETANAGSGSGNVVAAGSGSAGATNPTPGSGSAEVGSGSQMAAVGSGSAEAPKAPTVETVIASNIDKATVEIVGTDQTGPAPFTAKLEKDKDYQVKVSAPGFATASMDVKGGAPKQTAKLAPKPKQIEVASTPDGGPIWLDNRMTGKVTPATIDIPKDKLAAKSFRISIRKAGFKPVEKTLKAADFAEGDDALSAKVEATLEKAAAVVRPPVGSGSGAGSGAGSAAGSGATTPPPDGGGAGSGSAAAPPPPPPPPPAEPEPKL